jgi:hypothetical protein
VEPHKQVLHTQEITEQLELAVKLVVGEEGLVIQDLVLHTVMEELELLEQPIQVVLVEVVGAGMLEVVVPVPLVELTVGLVEQLVLLLVMVVVVELEEELEIQEVVYLLEDLTQEV